MTLISYEERDVFIVWTLNDRGVPAMLGLFEDQDEAKACCEKIGDCVQPTRLNKNFSYEDHGEEAFGDIWHYGKDSEDESSDSELPELSEEEGDRWKRVSKARPKQSSDSDGDEE